MFLKFPLFEGDDGASNAGGASVEPAPSADPAIVAPVNDFASSIPEEYHSEAYVQNLLQSENPQQELWKQFSGLQKAIGQRPGGMPSDDAPDDDWEKWTAAVAPKDISVYGDIKPILTEDQSHLKDMIEASYTPEFTATILEAFRKEGIPARSVKNLVNVFNQGQLQAAQQFSEQAQQETAKLDKQFDEMMSTTFGQDKAKVLEVGSKFIKEHIPPALQQSLQSRPNDELVTLAAAIYKLHNTYGKEDKLPTGGGQGYAQNDEISLKAAIETAMTEENGAYANPMDAKHSAQVAKVKGLCDQLSKLTKPRGSY